MLFYLISDCWKRLNFDYMGRMYMNYKANIERVGDGLVVVYNEMNKEGKCATQSWDDC